MTKRRHPLAAALILLLAPVLTIPSVVANENDYQPGPASWVGDLTPITEADWSYDRAEHLLGEPVSAAHRTRFSV